jgi:hypothetical protein
MPPHWSWFVECGSGYAFGNTSYHNQSEVRHLCGVNVHRGALQAAVVVRDHKIAEGSAACRHPVSF